MRKCLLFCFAVITAITAVSQDFSNKGKEFWLCFPQHVPTGNNSLATLSIFITSDMASSGTISMPNGAFNGTFNIPANGIQEIQIPWNANIHIANSESNTVLNKSIHIKTNPGQPPVVAYAQQWAGARSAATLLLPTSVVGRKYYAMSMTQNGSNSGSYLARSQFQIIAVNDNTVVNITPVKNGVLGVTFQITLPTAGNLYQYQSTDGAAASQDITGTYIESIASGSAACQPIIVFSGSSNCTFGTATPACNGSSYDPLWQQMYPVSSWGKSFGFIPFQDYLNRGNPYRVIASQDGTKVFFNGVAVATLNAGQIYPATYTSQPAVLTSPTYITADKPICVAHYAQADACTGQTGNPRVGDPDMVILNPIEQNISDITIFSSTRQAITHQWVNVLLKTAAVPSFKISKNGGPLGLPVAAWQNFAALPGYSYLQESLIGASSARMLADSGFNAIAYGFGNVESYAYSAGTNVRDLTQQLELETQYGIETSPSVCDSAPFIFKVYFPDSTLATPPAAIRFDSLDWNLTNPSLIVPNNFPIRKISPTIDSTNIRNGRQVNWYSLPGYYYFSAPGLDTLVVTAYQSTNEGCGFTADYGFPIVITGPPVADFSFNTGPCFADSVQFTETTPQFPKATYHFWWDFGEPASGIYNTSSLRNPKHQYAVPGTYTVRFADITTSGCLSDTVTHQVTVAGLPDATIDSNHTVCINSLPGPYITFRGTGGAPPYSFYYNINGGAEQTVTSVGASTTAQVFASTTVAGTFVYTLDSVRNTGSTRCVRSVTGQKDTIVVLPDATITLTSAPGTNNQTVCVSIAIVPITYLISGSGTGGTITAGGLPPGVTGVYAGTVFTISGTPTVAGVYNYTLTTTGPCGNVSLSGTINVTGNSAIALSSAAGTDNQTVCINNPIVDITYAVTGTATGATLTAGALPAGVTGIYSAGVFTISGTPTVSGVFNYTITSTGPCLNPTASGTITVNDNSLITLTSAAGTDNQTTCIGNPITNITYAIAGGGTGATVTGLPTGVNGVFAGGVFTISGAPTVSGVFSYTVTTLGPCINNSVNGTITVNANSTIALSSAVGTDNQTVCINNPIVDITYSVGQGGTGATITAGGLPAGVTSNYAGSVFTITGTPTVSGIFNYTVTTIGPCINTSLSGTIHVNANSTITLTSAAGTDNQTVCINNPIVNISYTVAGGGTGAIITAGGLPAGVTGLFTGGVFTITGTPTVSGVFPYTITTNGPCINPSVSGLITVNANSTIALTSAAGTANQAVCRLSPIGTITYSMGAGATGISITAGGLPAGVTGVFGGGIFTISGTPTVSGVFNYTVTTSGPCINPSLSGTITVYALPTPNFTFNTPSCETRTISFTDGSAPNQGTLASWSWNFGDPGSGAANTSTLQNPVHTFAVAGVYNVTLTATSTLGCNSIPPRTIAVTINARPQAGFIIPEVCLSDTYAQFLDTSKVALPGTLVAWAWNFGDPASGVNNTSTLQNPQHSYSAVGPYNVRLIVTSSAGCKDTIVQVLTVNGSFPISSFTVNNPATLCANDSVSIVNHSTVFPGVITQAEITWDLVNFPAAVQVDPNPFFGKVYQHLYPNFQVPATKNFTIRFRAYSGGVCLKDTMQTITVHAAPKVQFNNMPDTCLLAAPYQLNQASEVGGVPGTGVFSGPGVSPTGIFSPAVAGIGVHSILYVFTSTAAGCVDSLRRNIRVLDTAHANFSYVTPACDGFPISFTDQSTAPAAVTPSGTVWNFGDGSPIQNHPAGSTFTHLFPAAGTYNVTMYDVSAYGCTSTIFTRAVVIDPNHTITLTSGAGSDNQVTCINVAINPITYALGGGATGATVTGLPAGISYVVTGTTLTISGAPATVVGSPFNYSIVTTGNACTTATASGTITVNDNTTIALSSAAGSDNQTICINTPLTPVTYAIGGGGTGAVISAGVLPAGITGNYSAGVFTISGTPTVSGVFNYTVSTTGPCVNPSLSGTITVLANSTIVLSSAAGTDNQTVCINTTPIDITYAIGGGGTGASITAGALPAGMSGNYAAGVFTITGTATASGVFNYTITTQGPCINPTLSGTITVRPDHSITLTSGSGSDTPRACLNTPITAVTYDIGGGATGFTITGLPPGVTATMSGNTITISGSPSSTTGTPYIYTITTTGNPCITASAMGKINVSPIPVPLFGFDKSFYCIPNALVGFTNNSTIEDGSENAFTYLWNFGDPASGFSNSSVAMSPTHYFSTVGPFNVNLKVTSKYGCPKDLTIALTSIHPQPKAGYTTDKPTACLGDNVLFSDRTFYPDGSASQYFWDFGDGTRDRANPSSHQYISADTFKVSYYVINSIGCNSDTLINQPFPVYNYPVVDAGPDRFILEGGSIVIQPVVTGQNLQFLWSPGTYLNDITLEKPTVSRPLTDITYTLKVTGIGGCAKSKSMLVKLLKFPQIPNTFTPNGDGRNDKWFITYLDTYPNNWVQVFTRTGQLIFESHGYKVPWDGTYKGKPLPIDTYYYIIEPGNGRDPLTGYVTIIK